ncbi:LLM class flavin-dependent oxidoreductase [Bradyrhizobium jicamae]|uniref:LLM class flavin-dependent oxidoreductase n=1 Tax=Bradyrhizobium jicamae TaxID=280332 RepID=UPI001BAB43E5|nr:LLM class flavin-dependent oxidoreductase [Bradyrhizobium jicamae]MBR0751280.1 LLM class flavin-dependent oxidoreductase [Bradyrhizobium jicamae]
MSLPNPMASSAESSFKLGVFSANADRGSAFTTVPEAWTAEWTDCLQAAQIADRGGFDFFLPIGRWRGYGGSTRVREHSFETFTFAAGLASVTSRIALFMTVHVPLLHPLYAAKALATVDHISRGRAGLNIVCGWNPDEFGMFGVTLVDDAYVQAREWLDVIVNTYNSDAPLDFAGKYYQLKDAVSRPASLQRPRPVTMNAAFGPAGRDFAAQHCDHLFTSFTDLDVARGHVRDIRDRADRFGRSVGIFTVAHVVCRETDAEAEDFYDYYSRRNVDEAAVDYHMRQKKNFSQSHEDDAFRLYRQRFAAGTGSYPLVGSPRTIVDELSKIAGIGYNGAALSFVNYRSELPFFCEQVIPRMKEAGL